MQGKHTVMVMVAITCSFGLMCCLVYLWSNRSNTRGLTPAEQASLLDQLHVVERQTTAHGTASVVGCVMWRQTGGCRAQGPREPEQDMECDRAVAPGRSGWCECKNGRTAKEVSCNHHGFRCDHQCALLVPNDDDDVDRPALDKVADLQRQLTLEEVKMEHLLHHRNQLERAANRSALP